LFDSEYGQDSRIKNTSDVATNQIGNFSLSNGYLNGTSTGTNPYIICPVDAGATPLISWKAIKVRFKNGTSSTSGRFYFTTTADQTWTEDKSVGFAIVANDSNYSEYVVDMTGCSKWTGGLYQLRFDPTTTTGNFSIDYVQLVNIQSAEGWDTADYRYDSNIRTTSGDAINQISGFGFTDGFLSGTSTGADPYIVCASDNKASLSNYNCVKIRFKNSTSSTAGAIYFTTTASTTWSESKAVWFTINANDPNYTEYTVDMSGCAGWTGTLRQLRFDPTTATGSFSIDYVMLAKNTGIKNLVAENGRLNGTIANSDPYIICRQDNVTSLSNNKFVVIRMKNSSANTTARVWFNTTTDSTWSSAKSKSFAIIANDSQCTEYVVDMSDVAGWTGTLKQLRLDPVDSGIAGGSFSIDSIFLTDATTYGYAANVVQNGDFDGKTLKNWSVYPTSSASWSVDATGGLNGAPAAKVSNVSADTVLTQTVCVVAGRQYVVECWMKANVADRATLSVLGLDANGNGVSGQYTLLAEYGTGAWKLMRFTYRPSAAVVAAFIQVGTYAGCANPIFFDAIQVTPLPNAVYNGEFTVATLTGWSTYPSGNAAWSVDPTAGRMNTPAAVVTNITGDSVQNQVVKIQRGRKYTISVWVKASTADRVKLQIAGRDASGNVISSEFHAVEKLGTGDWMLLSLSYTPTAGVVDMFLQFGVSAGDTGTVYFDDVTCIEAAN
jgi:hypothetical protein